MKKIRPNTHEGSLGSRRYPIGGTFGQLLSWHLYVNGTRPSGSPDRTGDQPWTLKQLAGAMALQPEQEPSILRKLYEWLDDGNKPKGGLFSLEHSLFGKNPKYDPWRRDLREAATRKSATQLRDGHELSVVDANIRKISDQFLGLAIKPSRPQRCIGRQADVERITSTLLGIDGASIIIHGAPGIGKTTLSREIANEPLITTKFGDRRYFVALENTRSIEDFRNAVVMALPGRDKQTSPVEAINSCFDDELILIIFDNLETPWEANSIQIEEELEAMSSCNNVFLLASFRGNDLPASPAWSCCWQLQPLAAKVAKELFLQIAPQVSSEDPNLVLLLEQLGGLPLAIELIALEARTICGLQELWDEWQRIGASAAKRATTPETRLTSLSCSIELSFDSPRRLPKTKKLLSIIAWLPNGADKDLCKALVGADFYATVRDVLASGLGFEVEHRIQLLPPIARHVRDFYEITEVDIRNVFAYYASLTDRVACSLHLLNDATAQRFLMSEELNICTILTITPHRMNLKTIERFIASLCACVQCTSSIQNLPDRYRFSTRIFSISNQVLRYVGLMICMRHEFDVGLPVLNAGMDLLKQVVRFMFAGTQDAIDEFRKAVLDFRALSKIIESS